jgi:hypothetical protein
MSGFQCDVRPYTAGDVPDIMPTRECICNGFLNSDQLANLPAEVEIVLGPTPSEDYPGFYWVELRFMTTLSITETGTLLSPSGCTLLPYALTTNETIVDDEDDVYRAKGSSIVVAQVNPTKTVYFGDDYLFNGFHCRILCAENGAYLIGVKTYDIDNSATYYICLNISAAGELIDMIDVASATFLAVTTGTIIYDNLLGIGTSGDIVTQVSFYNTVMNMLGDPNGVPTDIGGTNYNISPVLHDAMVRVSPDPMTGLMAINGICKLLPK